MSPENTLQTSNSDQTCYQWHGESGPVVVLIHGLGLNQDMWQWQIPSLSKHYQVLSYDLIGHGQTPATDKPQSLTLFSQQLRGLLDEHKIKQCAVVGFSLGGMIARRFAMDYPDYVLALAILNSPHARSEQQQQSILDRVEQAAVEGPAATVDAALERWFTPQFRQANPKVMQRVKNWVLANSLESYPHSYRVLAMGVDELVAPQPPIACPALVMCAQDDFGQPAQMAMAIANEIPQSTCIVVPGLRHMALVESPQIYNQALIDFFSHTLNHE